MNKQDQINLLKQEAKKANDIVNGKAIERDYLEFLIGLIEDGFSIEHCINIIESFHATLEAAVSHQELLDKFDIKPKDLDEADNLPAS